MVQVPRGHSSEKAPLQRSAHLRARSMSSSCVNNMACVGRGADASMVCTTGNICPKAHTSSHAACIGYPHKQHNKPTTHSPQSLTRRARSDSLCCVRSMSSAFRVPSWQVPQRSIFILRAISSSICGVSGFRIGGRRPRLMGDHHVRGPPAHVSRRPISPVDSRLGTEGRRSRCSRGWGPRGGWPGAETGARPGRAGPAARRWRHAV